MVQIPSRGCRSGFTLLELLVVMALIGIMAGFVLPRIGGNSDRLRFKTAVKDVASLMRYARSQAVTRGQIFTVAFESMENQIIVSPAMGSSGQSGYARRIPGIEGRHLFQLPDSVTLDSEAFGGQGESEYFELVKFFPIGNSTGALVVLTDTAGRKKTIHVDLVTGLVTIDE